MAEVLYGIESPIEVGRRTMQELHLPNWVTQGFTFIHTVHFWGRTWVRFERRVKHPVLYLGGAFLNQQLGDSTVVRVTAQIVLIARILLQAFEDGANIIRCWNGCTEVLKGTDMATYGYLAEGLSNPRWEREEGEGIIGELFFSKKIAIVAHRIYLVVIRTFTFLEAIVKLSFRFLELYDAIMIDPYTRAAAIDDLLIELTVIGDQVAGDTHRLERAIEMYKPMINKTFEFLRLDWTASGLTKRLNALAEHSIVVKKVYEDVVDIAENAGRGMIAVGTSLFGAPLNQKAFFGSPVDVSRPSLSKPFSSSSVASQGAAVGKYL